MFGVEVCRADCAMTQTVEGFHLGGGDESSAPRGRRRFGADMNEEKLSRVRNAGGDAQKGGGCCKRRARGRGIVHPHTRRGQASGRSNGDVTQAFSSG